MGPRKLRALVVVAAATALAIATIAPSSAQDAPPAGTGTSSGSTSLLNVLLGGDSLALRLLGEDSSTTNDPDAGGPRALERVTPLQVASTLVPQLGAASRPAVETSSTDGEDSRSTPPVNLGSLLGGLPVPGLLGGTIEPLSLRSIVDERGALSGATGAITDLSVLGGLLSLGTANADLGSSALVTDAGALRGLELDRLEVLDLTALLDALGISLADLPLDAAVGLLDGLGLPLPDLLDGVEDPVGFVQDLLDETASVRSAVAPLQAQIDTLQAQLAPLTSQLESAVAQVTSLTAQLAAAEEDLLGSTCVLLPDLCALIDSLTAQLATAEALVTDLNAQIDAIQAQIDALADQIDGLLATITDLLDQLLGIIDPVLDTLEGAPLLVVEDLVVGLTARADDTLETSVAEVVGSIGAVRIGALPSLGGIDATSALSQVTALTNQITGTLGELLSTIDPALADLVDLDLLDQITSVTEADGVTNATAGITALRATITPPDVCALLGRLGAQETVGSVLGGLGESLPSLPGPVGDVLGDLGSVVDCEASAATAGTVGIAALVDGVASALTQPLTVEALSISGTGAFFVPATPGGPATPGTPGAPGSPGGSLPKTGGDAQLAILAAALGVAAFGARRLLARAA